MGINSFLSSPRVYRLFCNIIGNEPRRVFVDRYVRPLNGESILDVGCGVGNLLSYLPDVNYCGLDMNGRYIMDAKKRYGDQGIFLQEKLSKETKNNLNRFDKVLAFGILHHLDDEECRDLFSLAKEKLNAGGRMFTLDIYNYQNQPWYERFLVSMDRGRHVRSEEEYRELARDSFGDIVSHKLTGVTRLPYSGLILELKR